MAKGQRFGPHRYEFELGKRNYNFEAQVNAIVAKTDKRMTALMRESIQRTIDDAQTPVAKGGRMRVDTGFLRASGQGSLTGMPTGPVREKGKTYSYSANITVVELGKMELGATFFFGWSANYAKYREAYDGFLEGAVQKWQQTVDAVAAEIIARIK